MREKHFIEHCIYYNNNYNNYYNNNNNYNYNHYNYNNKDNYNINRIIDYGNIDDARHQQQHFPDSSRSRFSICNVVHFSC